jgi:hypothetical protein
VTNTAPTRSASGELFRVYVVPTDPRHVLFSNATWLHLRRHMNSQYNRHWLVCRKPNDMPLHYVMAGVWCAMSATTINRAMCVRWVCKVRKPIPEPSWNIMSEHLILNTIQWTTLCGPQLMENWKAAGSDKWYWWDKIMILQILTLPLVFQLVALKMFRPGKL